ncbi:MAG TPA: hypothetical protein VN181_03495 [Thermoanaerobaculia bacterium]|nr:hypothetical protein [Thermoanaerobaculia bacterium]
MARRKHTPAPARSKRMPRRGHPIIPQIEGLREWLIEQYKRVPRPTLGEIREELKGTGFLRKLKELDGVEGLGKTTISEFFLAFKAQEAERELFVELAALYNDIGRDGSVLEVASATGGLAHIEIFKEFLAAARDGKAIDGERLEQFRKLAASMATVEKAKHWIDSGRAEALALVRAEMRELLKDDPPTLRRVLEKLEALGQEKS